MSAYGTKVVAVLDTASTFGTTIRAMREAVVNRGLLKDNTLNMPVVAPTNPVEGDIYFDKNILKLKIYINDGNSSQWVQI